MKPPIVNVYTRKGKVESDAKLVRMTGTPAFIGWLAGESEVSLYWELWRGFGREYSPL